MDQTRLAGGDPSTEFGAGRPHDTRTPDIETASDRYAERRFGGAVGQWLLAQQTAAIDQVLARTGAEPMRVLEVGGGHGQLTPHLLQAGHSVVVQGSDPVCMRRIAAPLREHPDRASGCVSDLWTLPFADRAFDFVMAVRLLGHVRRWQDLLTEMTRVSDRWLLIEFARARRVALPSVGQAIFALKHRVEGTTRPFFAYREQVLVETLAALSFRAVATVGQFALPMVAHRLAKSPGLSARLERGLRAAGVGDGARSPVMLLAERVVPAEEAKLAEQQRHPAALATV